MRTRLNPLFIRETIQAGNQGRSVRASMVLIPYSSGKPFRRWFMPSLNRCIGLNPLFIRETIQADPPPKTLLFSKNKNASTQDTSGSCLLTTYRLVGNTLIPPMSLTKVDHPLPSPLPHADGTTRAYRQEDDMPLHRLPVDE